MRRTITAKDRAQGMTEYLLIVALIAITTIAVIKTTAGNLKAGFGKIANAIAGRNSGIETNEVTDAQVKKRTMKDFDFDAD